MKGLTRPAPSSPTPRALPAEQRAPLVEALARLLVADLERHPDLWSPGRAGHDEERSA